MTQVTRQTHLEYYQEHEITPVRYDLSSLDAHMERRSSLYSKIGLPQIAFTGSRVLEVAAGTGHNSLYIAQTMPAQLVLLEPNPAGIEHIKNVYKAFDMPHTAPEYVFLKLEDYQPDAKFDVVLCENWLGTSQHELSLLDKLSNMVAEQGVLVLTTVSPIGFVPNLLRRYLSVHLSSPDEEFNRRTDVLTKAFTSHLETLAAMTRNVTDWVHDNMMNPAYFGLCLSAPQLIERIGKKFDVIGSSPSIAEDWRWFKSMHGDGRQFNDQYLSEYWAKAHNFMDYRAEPHLGDIESNAKLEEAAVILLTSIKNHEDVMLQGKDVGECAEHVLTALDQFIVCLPPSMMNARNALSEARELVSDPSSITPDRVRGLSDFSSLFGRETMYVSMVRNCNEAE